MSFSIFSTRIYFHCFSSYPWRWSTEWICNGISNLCMRSKRVQYERYRNRSIFCNGTTNGHTQWYHRAQTNNTSTWTNHRSASCTTTNAFRSVKRTSFGGRFVISFLYSVLCIETGTNTHININTNYIFVILPLRLGLEAKVAELEVLGTQYFSHLNWLRNNWAHVRLPPLFVEIFDIPKRDDDEWFGAEALSYADKSYDKSMIGIMDEWKWVSNKIFGGFPLMHECILISRTTTIVFCFD